MSRRLNEFTVETDPVAVGETISLSFNWGTLSDWASEEIQSAVVTAYDGTTDVTGTIVKATFIADGADSAGTTKNNAKVVVTLHSLTGNKTYKVTIAATVSASKVYLAVFHVPVKAI